MADTQKHNGTECMQANLNRTDNYDVAKIKMKSVTDHQ